MAAYATQNEIELFGSMPAEDIAALETLYPGIVAATSTYVSALFDAKLAKRYGAPFNTPYPFALVYNVARVVAYRLWLKRGYNPNGQLDVQIKADADEALAWLAEAANSATGLVELPITNGALNGASAITQGAPLAYTEASPYVWTDKQRETGRAEDGAFDGTFIEHLN